VQRGDHQDEEDISHADRWRALDADALHGETWIYFALKPYLMKFEFSDQGDPQEPGAHADGAAIGEGTRVLQLAVQLIQAQRIERLHGPQCPRVRR